MYQVEEVIEEQKAKEKQKEQELEAQQEWGINIFRLMLTLKEMRDDQLQTNKQVRAVCAILLISWAIGAIGIILGFIIPNFLGNDSKSEPVTPPTPPSYYRHR